MNNLFAAKLLQNLRNKKGNKGFTLIELLVVVIIIGVLAAVALPNLLGQVGKARESEAKNAMGTLNRAQQSYHFEKQTFGPALNDAALGANNALGVVLDSNYYTFATTLGTAAQVTASTNVPTAGDAAKNGTRPYSAGIGFTGGQYNSVVCQTDQIQDAAIGVTAGTSPSCAANSTELK
jgi:prepilin-type N-terminal cleavage/methylation domain-containing protein